MGSVGSAFGGRTQDDADSTAEVLPGLPAVLDPRGRGADVPDQAVLFGLAP